MAHNLVSQDLCLIMNQHDTYSGPGVAITAVSQEAKEARLKVFELTTCKHSTAQTQDTNVLFSKLIHVIIKAITSLIPICVNYGEQFCLSMNNLISTKVHSIQ